MRKPHAYQASFIAIAAATLIGQSAFAQSAAPAKDGATQGLEEVVVVARRTEERLQDVPVTVTAVSAQTLKEAQITTGTDLIKLVPSLNVSQQATGAGPIYALRGIRDGVVTYFADVPIDTKAVDDQIWDLGSVQALAGPQGTLFGKATTGGAVLFVPQRPTKTFGGYLDAAYGNYNYEELNGVINLPVNDMLQLRLGARLEKHDGMVKNIGGGPDMDSRNRYQFRASALFSPTATITDYLVADYEHRDEAPPTQISSFLQSGGIGAVVYGAGTLPALGAAQLALGTHTINSPFPAYDRSISYGFSNVFTDSLGHGLTFKYILGYRSTELHDFSSKSGLPIALELGDANAASTNWTNEIQLLGKAFNDRLSYTVGFFDLQENDSSAGGYQLFGSPGQVFNDSPNINVANTIDHFPYDKNSTEAVYAQGTYALTDKLNFTAGVRYTQDKGSTFVRSFTPANFFFGTEICGLANGAQGVNFAACTQNQSLSSNAVTYNISVDYHFSTNVMAYFTTRRGYNGGGFNASAPPNPPPGVPQPVYLPEYVTDYELGAKTQGTLAGMPIRANLSGYLAKYTNIQRASSGVTATGTYSGTSNGPQATIYGIVLESLVRPVHDFTINFNYGFLHTQYDVGAPGFPKGNVFGQSPEHTINLSGTYRHDLAQGGAAVATISYAYQSQISFLDSNVGLTHYLQPGYGVADARIGWESVMNSNVDVTFFVKNLTDVQYAVDLQDLGSLLGYTANVYNDPRTYGIQVHYRFGG